MRREVGSEQWVDEEIGRRCLGSAVAFECEVLGRSDDGFDTCWTPTPCKEQKSAEVIEKKERSKWEVQKSEKTVASGERKDGPRSQSKGKG